MARTPAPGTRERILEVAARLFYAHGVQAIGMNRIIAEAHTGKNLLYQHFPTKSDLVGAYLRTVDRIRERSAREARAAACPDPRSQLLALFSDVAAKARTPGFRGCAFRNYLAEFPPSADPDTAVDIALGYLHRTRGEMAELVGALDVADAATLVEQLWLVLDGAYTQAVYRDHVSDQHLPHAETAVTLAAALIDRSRRR